MYRLCRLLFMLTILTITCLVLLFLLRLGPFILIGVPLAIIAYANRRILILTAHGTARWAGESELRAAGMIGAKDGLSLGQADVGRPSRWAALRQLFHFRTGSKEACRYIMEAFFTRKPGTKIVRLANIVHCGIFCPTGGGKGVSCVLPFLFESPDSVVVVDFKGENAKLTAEHRKNAFGHRVVLLDPFKMVTETPDSFNPLDKIDKDSPHAIDDCRDLAESQVIRTGHEADPHWLESAETVIAAIAASVVYFADPDDRSMQTIRNVLTNPPMFEAVVNMLCASDSAGGLLARMGTTLTYYKDKELNSTLTTTNRNVNYLDTPAVVASTRSSSFDPDELLTGKMSIYLVLPPQHARTLAPLLRMWISSTLRACGRGGLQETNKVHFILDEAATLGHLDILDDAVDKYRGYGVRLQFYYQSLGQLKKCWPDGQDQTLLSNVTQVFFAVNDPQTAEYISTRLGESTIVVDSGGTSSGTSTQRSKDSDKSITTSTNSSSNWQQSARKLLKPEEVMGLSPRTAITFTQGIPPIRTTLSRYYEEKPREQSGVMESVRTLAIATIYFAFAVLIAVVLIAKQFQPIQYRKPSVSPVSSR